MGPAKLVAAIGLVLGPAVGLALAVAGLTATVDAYVAQRDGRVVGVAPHLLVATAAVVGAAFVS